MALTSRRVSRGLVVLCMAGALAPVSAGGSEAWYFDPRTVAGAYCSPDALTPVVRKQYLPQAMGALHSWSYPGYTNYARERYERYLNRSLLGDRFYDVFGSYVAAGWHLYSWHQQYSQTLGSAILKAGRMNRLVISSSSRGGLHTAITVGEGIRTILTPLTFSKPLYDGLQWDTLTDRWACTVLASRVDAPGKTVVDMDQGPSRKTVFTQLLGLRGTIDVGEYVKLGATYVTAFHQNAAIPLQDNSLRGVLGGRLNAGDVELIVVRFTDDSPDEQVGGALLYRDIILVDGIRHPEIKSQIDGGYRHPGSVEARGPEAVTLTYNIAQDFRPTPQDEITDYRDARRIEVEVAVADDYRIEVASNMQTNNLGEPAFLVVARAAGNVSDGSNLRVIRFDYGLPSANELGGATLEIGAGGFSLQGELVVNRRSRRFPNQRHRTGQTLAADRATAYCVRARQMRYPFFAYGEAFSIDPNYTTSMFIPGQHSTIDYQDERTSRYEFVDDNDDQDRYPDWERRYTSIYSGDVPDREVFPGLDENLDFVSDFNQNRNNRPDYAEPFLRHHVDPPEFLFGLDMNSNGVIDRFEDDREADYPYKRDRRGYNAYVGVELAPRSQVMVGRHSERQIGSGLRSRMNYVLVKLDGELPERGVRVRLMNFARKTRDEITDDVLQWVETPLAGGTTQDVPDELLGRNAVMNTLYLDATRRRALSLAAKVKVETVHHLGQEAKRRDNCLFIGVMTRADWEGDIGPGIRVSPRWKQLLAMDTDGETGQDWMGELAEIASVLVRFPVMRNAWIDVGVEHEIHESLGGQPGEAGSGYRGDGSQSSLAIQLTEVSEYLGYRITATSGFRWIREVSQKESSRHAIAFVSLYAGLGTDR